VLTSRPETVPEILSSLKKHAHEALEEAKREPSRALAGLLGFSTMIAVVLIVMRPWLADTSTFGFHDWDVQTSHRYLVKKSLLEFHEWPLWNPYACGGFPAWGFVEGGTTLVSPWLVGYLALPMSLAIRVEVLGMALLSAFGAYAAASRFTKSHAARVFVAAIWAVNGRWALQAAAGHTWHFAYCFLPWAFFFFERARARPYRFQDLAFLGATFAALVYTGGIYPLPHTILSLGLYAAVVSAQEKSARPFFVLGASGILGIGLSAPKLIPMLQVFQKAPRLVPSTEALDLSALFTLLTSRQQAFYDRPARVPAYGWHEWGMYISLPGLLILLLAFVFVQGKREAALKLVGLVLGILGLGAFHPASPWTLLHDYVPVFRSQHVPSRFLYPAVFVLAIVAAAGMGRWIEKASRKRPWLDALLLGLVCVFAFDVAAVAQRPMQAAMWMVPPNNIPQDKPFHFEKGAPFQYVKRDWAGPMYLAMLGNTGVLECYGAPPFEGHGALAANDPAYRGEVFVLEGQGTARIAEWTLNSATISLEGVSGGALVVYNMNYDPGWRASVGDVENNRDRVAVRVPAGTDRVTLRYRPRGLTGAIFAGLIALVGVFVGLRRERLEEQGKVES